MALQTSTFTTADANGPGPGFTLVTTAVAPAKGITITGGAAVADAIPLSHGLATTVPTGAAQFAQASAAALLANTGVVVRAVAEAGNVVSGYMARHAGGSLGLFRLAVDGTAVELAKVNNTRRVGQVLRLTADGSTLTVLLDGVQLLQATDSTYTRVGTTGFRLSGAVGAAIDNYYGGDLAEIAGVPSGALASGAAPAQVTALIAPQAAGEASVGLSWAPVAGATTYLVEYRKTTSGTWLEAGVAVDAAYILSGLLSGTAYLARVTARNLTVPGTPSAALTFTTAGVQVQILRVPRLNTDGRISSAYLPVGTYFRPGGGIPASDLDEDLQGGLTAALSATGATGATKALGIFRAGLIVRGISPCRLVFTGSSTTEGVAASTELKRYVNLLVAQIQAAYPSGTGAERPVIASDSATWGTLSSAGGVHGYNAGQGGTTSADYLTPTERTRIAAIAPRMVMHMVGANDYRLGIPVPTFKANLAASIAAIQSAMTTPCVHVLVKTYPRYDAATISTRVAPWEDYGKAMVEIAVADPTRVAFIDISEPYALVGVPGADPLDLITSDDVHQNDAGHAFMADLLRDGLKIPGAASGTSAAAPPTAMTLTASPSNGAVNLSRTGGEGTGVTYALYRATTATGSPIATTLPYADTGRTNDVTVSYIATATNAAGSVTSNVATATPSASAGYDYGTDARLLSEFTPTNLSDGVVSSWTPARGSQLTPATQATSTAQPTRASSVLNGHPAVLFDGSDTLVTAAWGSAPDLPLTIIAVAKVTTGTSRVLAGITTGVKTVALGRASATPFGFYTQAGASATIATASAPSNDYHLLVSVLNGADSRLYVDSRTPLTGDLSNVNATPAGLTGIRIGSGSSGTAFLNGGVALLAVVGGALTQLEVSDLLSALGTKYALPVAA